MCLVGRENNLEHDFTNYPLEDSNDYFNSEEFKAESSFLRVLDNPDTTISNRKKALLIAKSLGYFSDIRDSYYDCIPADRDTTLSVNKDLNDFANYLVNTEKKFSSEKKKYRLGQFNNIMNLITTPAPISPNLLNKEPKPKSLSDPDYIEALRELNKEFPCVGDESL